MIPKKKPLPYQYPLLTWEVAFVGGLELIKTVSFTIPPNSKFVWLHTLNGTLQTIDGNVSIRIQLYDSVYGSVCNVPTDIENLSGAIYLTFENTPRDIRPFPLPETYVFNAGATITATYTIRRITEIAYPAFSSVGIILCGYRIPI